MSAWTVGTQTVTRRKILVDRGDALDKVDASAPPAPTLDTLIAWIPGEVIAAYGAVVLALQPTQDGSSTPPPMEITSYVWLVGGVVLAAIMTFLGGWSKTDDLNTEETKELAARMVLAAAAFAIWSFVIPGSWWYSIEKVSE